MGLVSEKRGKLVLRPFRGRKANILHEIYLLIFQFVMVFLVALALFQYINNVATDLGFEKRFTSIDIGLLTTTVHTAPGTMKYIYYLPIDFPVPMVFGYRNSLIDIMEQGEELHMAYWFLTDHNIDPIDADIEIRASAMAREAQRESSTFGSTVSAMVEDLRAGLINITYFKSGRQVVFAATDANPLQLVCPVLNTTNEFWSSEQVFLMKVFGSQEDYSNADIPANRITQILSARYENFQSERTGSSGATQMGSTISAVPDTANIVIVFGDAGEEREPGSLIFYIPVDSSIMKARKFACFLMNDLLTEDSVVYYNQIMPVYLSSLDDDSPLKVFDEKAREDQIMVFVDISGFTTDQVDVEAFSEALYRAFLRYYGETEMALVPGAPLSFTAPTAGSAGGVSGPVVSGTPPEQLTGTGDNAAARMFSVCSESELSLEAGLNRLKSVAAYWVQQSQADGAVYVKGGQTSGGRCSNNGRPEWVMETLQRYYPSDPLPSICNPNSGNDQTDACRDELRRVYQSKVVDRFSGRYLCADCMTYLVQMFRCAFGSLHHYTNFPSNMPVIAGTRGAISGYSSEGDVIFNDNVWGVTSTENCWDSVVVGQLNGRLQFGDVIELIPNHYVLYTGGVGLDYELAEMGGYRFPSASGINSPSISMSINGVPVTGGVRTEAHADVALRAARKGCLIRRAATEPSRRIF